jgi:hypothetical protein
MAGKSQGGDRDGLDTLAHWLSEPQWRAAVDRIKQRARAYDGHDRRNRRQPRIDIISRCLIRLENPGRSPGIYIVRSRNISERGLCVIHATGINPWKRVTVAIETPSGNGVIVNGAVAWCQRIPGPEPSAYEVGIEFDTPIDVTRFPDAGAA